MTDVAVREATRAVESDYTNPSAHLFWRTPSMRCAIRTISLRYETPWFNELLLANLLSPVAAGPCRSSSRSRNTRNCSSRTASAAAPSEWRDTENCESSRPRSSGHRELSFGIDAVFLRRQATPNARGGAHGESTASSNGRRRRTTSSIFSASGRTSRAATTSETYDNQPLSPGDFSENAGTGCCSRLEPPLGAGFATRCFLADA